MLCRKGWIDAFLGLRRDEYLGTNIKGERRGEGNKVVEFSSSSWLFDCYSIYVIWSFRSKGNEDEYKLEGLFNRDLIARGPW